MTRMSDPNASIWVCKTKDGPDGPRRDGEERKPVFGVPPSHRGCRACKAVVGASTQKPCMGLWPRFLALAPMVQSRSSAQRISRRATLSAPGGPDGTSDVVDGTVQTSRSWAV
uniref:Uncharacterized protein n=1 Tax=Eutreptiella gymnastica TaxID=73025 RepID=A0A7S4GM19_9EUGL